MELQQTNLHLDISAHLVRTTIPRDSPVLRVLFHAGADPGGHLQRQKICVLLHVSMGSRTPLKGRCMPEGEDGVCVAEVSAPLNRKCYLCLTLTSIKLHRSLYHQIGGRHYRHLRKALGVVLRQRYHNV